MRLTELERRQVEVMRRGMDPLFAVKRFVGRVIVLGVLAYAIAMFLTLGHAPAPINAPQTHTERAHR